MKPTHKHPEPKAEPKPDPKPAPKPEPVAPAEPKSYDFPIPPRE